MAPEAHAFVNKTLVHGGDWASGASESLSQSWQSPSGYKNFFHDLKPQDPRSFDSRNAVSRGNARGDESPPPSIHSFFSNDVKLLEVSPYNHEVAPPVFSTPRSQNDRLESFCSPKINDHDVSPRTFSPSRNQRDTNVLFYTPKIHEHESSPRALGPPRTRSQTGSCCRCGRDFSAIAPPVDPTELFVNITVHDIEDLHPVRGPVQSVQTWVAGLMGQVIGGGKTHFNHIISDGHFEENELGIKAEITKVFFLRHWNCEITTMLLPPTRGMETSAKFIQMTRHALPIFMVFRVQLEERFWLGGCDCRKLLPYHRLVNRREFNALGEEIQNALFHPQYMRYLRGPMKTEVIVADAEDEMHVLYNKHWSDEQAADCILQSRQAA